MNLEILKTFYVKYNRVWCYYEVLLFKFDLTQKMAYYSRYPYSKQPFLLSQNNDFLLKNWCFHSCINPIIFGDYSRDLLLFAGESIREEMNTTKDVIHLNNDLNHPNNDVEAPNHPNNDGEASDINITNTKAEKDILLLEISTKYLIKNVMNC